MIRLPFGPTPSRRDAPGTGRRPGAHVRRQLAVMVAGAVALVAGMAIASIWGQSTSAHYDRVLGEVHQAQQLELDGHVQHQALRADVLAALAARAKTISYDGPAAIELDAAHEQETLTADGVAVGKLRLSRALTTELATAQQARETFAANAVDLVDAVFSGKRADLAVALTAMDEQHDALDQADETLSADLAAADDAAKSAAATARRLATIVNVGGGLLAVVVLALLGFAVRRSILGVTGRLEGLLQRNETEAASGDFARRLSDAFEMSDDEAAAHAVASRAMAMATDRPAELLLADSSRAHLHVAATHPEAGGACCPVSTPYECVAVRRGAAVRFEDSEDLAACPKLRDRDGERLSATCVPVTFMGRALGVVHTTGPAGAVHDEVAVGRLTQLASQAGTRIGTLRATRQTQLQAATDGLTGLANRRTLDEHVRGLLKAGQSFALAFADLDHFKTLNDKHGHETGDRALRLFAKVLRDGVRDGDFVARYGGEEFVLVLPGRTASEAKAALDRLRLLLSEAVALSDLPSFTASFGVTDSSAGVTVDDVVRVADAALLAAKESGRDRVVVAGTHRRDVPTPAA